MLGKSDGGSKPDVIPKQSCAENSVSLVPDPIKSSAGTADLSENLRLHAEEITVERRRVAGDTVRVSTRVRLREEEVEVGLLHERVEVERVAIDRIVEAVPPVRQEGDVTVLSVVEEVLVLERRLLLKEEVRVRRVQVPETHRETVSLREQVIDVSRVAHTEV